VLATHQSDSHLSFRIQSVSGFSHLSFNPN
jgi:hypothetical protein